MTKPLCTGTSPGTWARPRHVGTTPARYAGRSRSTRHCPPEAVLRMERLR